jgi:CHAT domain-containing protein
VANPLRLPQIHGTPLPPLPGTAAEVAAIAKTVPSSEVTILEGSRASASNLIQSLPDATVLHFATHAIVSGTDPFSSFLALNRTSTGKPTPQNPAPDGLLTTASIYSLRLHTRMVVLSACRTGLGPVSADGVAGQSRAQALRSAQLELIAQLRAGRLRVPVGANRQPIPERPAYWAAFSLSGQP